MCLQLWSVVKLQNWTYGEPTTPRKKGQKMKPNEYLDAAKTRLKIESDYELAKRFGAHTGSIAEIRNGKRAVPLDVAFKLAITLELDPAQVVADLEAQREKNPTRQGFWHSFLSRAAVVAALACTLALSFSAICGSDVSRAAALFKRPRKYA